MKRPTIRRNRLLILDKLSRFGNAGFTKNMTEVAYRELHELPSDYRTYITEALLASGMIVKRKTPLKHGRMKQAQRYVLSVTGRKALIDTPLQFVARAESGMILE